MSINYEYGFRHYFSEFLDRLLTWRTLIRFAIPLFVFLVAAISYPLIKLLYDITDTTFLTWALICGGGISFLLISFVDRLRPDRPNNLKAPMPSREYHRVTRQPVCKNCGALITGESPSEDPTQRKPCPQCGSLARMFDVRISEGFSIRAGLAGVVITYPETLLTTARDMIDSGEFSIAVAAAHMACEISVERALSRALAAKGIGYLEDAIGDLSPGYNLANDRVRNLYNAVTGDEIQKQSFWQAFKESTTRRNKAVHGAKIVTKAEAEASFKAASDLVAYLK